MPKTATVSPPSRRAFFSACSDVDDEHIMIAPCSSDTCAGSTKRFRSGMQMNSAHPPSRCLPIIWPVAQNCSWPDRQ